MSHHNKLYVEIEITAFFRDCDFKMLVAGDGWSDVCDDFRMSFTEMWVNAIIEGYMLEKTYKSLCNYFDIPVGRHWLSFITLSRPDE